MSLAENLLNSLETTNSTSSYSALNEEPHIVVGADRNIIVPQSLRKIAVTGDTGVETVTFDCVRYWDGNDLSTFAIYLNYVLPDRSIGTYIPKSITANDGEDVFHFDWEINRYMTKSNGTIAFSITAIKTKLNESGETVVDKQWGSFPNTECSIVDGIDIANVPDNEETEDILAQITEILEKIQGGLGGGGGTVADNIPEYVKNEAESVINKVIAAQVNRTFTFAAITDMHYGSWNYYPGITDYSDGIKHACQALKYIDERIKLDAVAILGDYTDGMANNQFETAVHDFKGVNAVLDKLRFAPNLRLQGNHDFMVKHSPVVYRYIGAYNDGAVEWGNPYGGYFYKDFDVPKIRVICLNTTEVRINGVDCSEDQYNWFIDSLDLSSKGDESDWGILVLSHIPVDMFAFGGKYRFAYILDAYKNGTSWTDGTISCDFSTGNNNATIVGNIHGHVHNLKMDKIYLGDINDSSTKQSDIWRMATPNACFGFENKDAYPKYQENESYIKTANSATDTAFCIYCVDLDACTIKSICYGAGYDRELKYAIPKPKYTNMLLKAEAYSSTDIYNDVGYKENVRPSEGSDTGDATCNGMYSTGYIPYSGQTTLYLKNVGFKADVPVPEQCVIQAWSSKNVRYDGSTVADVLTSSQYAAVTDETGAITKLTIPSWFRENCKYIRICCGYLGDDSIITLDEQIEYEDVEKYYVKYRLENVKSSSTVSSVEKGGSYSTTLTATVGTTIKHVIVEMGGSPITSIYYDESTGVLEIPAVTGDVVITAVAQADTPTYTNVLTTAEAYDSTAPYNGVGYKADVRPSTSTGTGETACVGMYSTGYIPYNGQTKLYLKNVGFKVDVAQVEQCVIQAWASKTSRNDGSNVTDVIGSSEWKTVIDATGAITELTFPAWFTDGCVYLRICCGYLGADSVITLDEQITKPAYTNVLPISTDANGNIYNGKGWKENTRWSG